MLVKTFIEEFINKRIQNTKTDNTIVSAYIKETLKVREYVPFREKRAIVELIVDENTKDINGVWKNDPITQYISFIAAMLSAHCDLELEDPIGDYDLLCESGLLMPILDTFRNDYNDFDVLLKMALAAKMEDNNIGVQVGKFLNGILWRLDDVVDDVKEKFGDFNLQNILGENFKAEDLEKLSAFLNKYNN